jgi:hypothetical protein
VLKCILTQVLFRRINKSSKIIQREWNGSFFSHIYTLDRQAWNSADLFTLVLVTPELKNYTKWLSVTSAIPYFAYIRAIDNVACED